MRKLLVAGVFFLGLGGAALYAAEAPRPNIVLIVADDLGYGDVGCYGATKLATPNMDRLGREGLRFTDAHATSATCTPSRYGILTGDYPWRKKGTGILPGDAALIIDPEHTTLPSMLKGAGYQTGIVGKWHLGLGGPGGPDWNGEIKPGPLEIGFDTAFIQPSTSDRVPCVYIEDHRVVGLDPKDPIKVSYDAKIGSDPTGVDHPELLKLKADAQHSGTIIDGISRIGYMTGGNAARWKDEDKADLFTEKAVGFIHSHAQQPFFLEFATHDPHVPRVPAPRFVGKSGLGVRGDAIVEFDWSVGQVLSAIDELHLTSNTIVIVTSDNGPVVLDGYDDGAKADLHGHTPGGPYRGGKYSVYEAGTRVPFILRWPQRVKPGVSDALVDQVDLLASLAALTQRSIPAGDAVDSRDLLPAFLGESKIGRDSLVEHDGYEFLAMRDKLWKYLPPNTRPWPKYSASGELYNLADDAGEKHNVLARESSKASQLSTELDTARQTPANSTHQN
jgi:arylsulfatase A-like enzyme